MKDVLAFTLGTNHPSSRLRIAAYAGRLAEAGWQLRMHPFDFGMGKSSLPTAAWWERAVRQLRRHYRGMKAASVLRQLDPRQPIIISRGELPVSRRHFLASPNPLALDVDDAIYLGTDRSGFDALCRRARIVVCGNRTLAANLPEHSGKCVIIPTAVDTDLYAVRKDYRANGALRIGWLGSSMSIAETLSPMADMLRDLRQRLNFELVVISDESAAFIHDASWVRFVKWSPRVEQSVAEHCDIGIMPLQDTPYQAAKCGAKLLQYMAAGLPVVASPVGVNREIVVNGVNGFWATNAQEWQAALQRLAGNEVLRATFGKAGRKHVEDHYSIARWTEDWVAVLNELAEA